MPKKQLYSRLNDFFTKIEDINPPDSENQAQALPFFAPDEPIPSPEPDKAEAKPTQPPKKSKPNGSNRKSESLKPSEQPAENIQLFQEPKIKRLPNPVFPSAPLSPEVSSEQPAGFMFEAGRIVPCDKPFTLPGIESLQTNQPVVYPADDSHSATMAIPFKLGDQSSGVLEIIDENRHDRKWTEDERQLAQEIAAQLALAIENARLYATVQQELAERVRAQSETIRRNQDLATLNRIGQELSGLTSQDEILQFIYTIMGEVLQNQNMTIALVNRDDNTLYLPIHVVNGTMYRNGDSPTCVDVAGYVFHTQTPLLLKGKVKEFMLEHNVVLPGQIPAAVMAIPLIAGDRPTGIIILRELENENAFTASHVELLSTIASQAATALENANSLKQTVRRNQDLASLNQIGQELSRLTGQDEILQLIYKSVGELLENENMTIALINRDDNTISLPIHVVKGKLYTFADSPTCVDVTRYVMKTKVPLLLNGHVAEFMSEHGIVLPAQVPASVLAIPMVASERSVGTIILRDLVNENAFTSAQVELLSTVASQATTGIENSNLFAEIRSALQAIENRERYQANVARAIALLSESGSRAMNDVLEALGNATQSTRVYYAQIQEEPLGMYWRAVAEWVMPDVPGLDPSSIQNMPIASFSRWAGLLREKGWATATPADSTPSEREFLESQQIQSSLLVAVPGKTATPSFIGFDQVDRSRAWQNEEVNILRVATDGLANTIVREDLLEQLQVSLDETENLYKASHRLALASNMQEMVAAIALSLHTPVINRAVLVLFHGELGFLNFKMEAMANWYGGRGSTPAEIGTVFERSVYQRLFVCASPVFHDDISHEPMDAKLRDTLQQENVRSLAVLPLWASKRQLGVLLLMSEERHHFTGLEIRSYPPLVDQMATSVENQSLFEQTQSALAETEQLYKITAGIAQASSMKDLVTLVGENILPDNADRVSLVQVSHNPEGEIIDLEVIGFYDRTGQYQRQGLHISPQDMPLIKQIQTEPEIYSDIPFSTLDSASKRTFSALDIQSICIIPMRSAGRLVGVLIATTNRSTDFNRDQVQLMNVAGNGMAIAMERQRLLAQTERRALELQAAAEIARDTTSTLALDKLLPRIVNLMLQRFSLYHVALFMLNEQGNYAVVREASGEAGTIMKQTNHRLKVNLKSIVGTTISNGTPTVVDDVSTSPIYSPHPALPETRSEVGIPLKLGQKIIGVLDVQSSRRNAFMPDDIGVLQILADQIAVAIENAQAYEISQKAIQDMREVDRLKSQFLANMSHELRTPLNSIIGFSRVILKGIDGPINEIQSQDLTAIYNSGQHLLNLINDILDLSKIEAGKMELSFSDVDLNDLINSVLSTVLGLLKDKPIKMFHNLPVKIPIIRADPTRVRQVLLNLVSNAAKFTEEGTIKIELGSQMSPNGKPEIYVNVTDTGTGIAQDDVNKLFQPFSQVDDSPTRKTGGTGLGLSICRSFIEMHGGRIGLLHSEMGKGSTFYFTLPIPETGLLPSLMDEPGQTQPIILSIDDDPQVISLYQRYLTPHGYKVVPLTNSKEALKTAREIRPFAITLDIMMPEKDGWSVIQELKNSSDTRNIPIIICSILEEADKGISMGAADYLTKPFLPEDLSKAINRLNQASSIHNILVIDNDPKDLRLTQKMLEDTGRFIVTTVLSGIKGWEVIQANRPDAVIMDLFMPDLNGFMLMDKLRADPALNEIPVILLTGADLTTEQHEQLSKYGKQLLTKGYVRENELLAALENMLRRIQQN